MDSDLVIEALLELAEYQRAEIAELQATCEELSSASQLSVLRQDASGEILRRE